MITKIMVMKIYNRKKELEVLDILDRPRPSFLVITGRRRVGKTELIKQLSRGRKLVYLFVDSNKSIDILMSEFDRILKDSLDLPEYIQLDDPDKFLQFITTYEKDLVLAIDEFQRFLKIYPSFITPGQATGGTEKGMRSTFRGSITKIKRLWPWRSKTKPSQKMPQGRSLSTPSKRPQRSGSFPEWKLKQGLWPGKLKAKSSWRWTAC